VALLKETVRQIRGFRTLEHKLSLVRIKGKQTPLRSSAVEIVMATMRIKPHHPRSMALKIHANQGWALTRSICLPQRSMLGSSAATVM